MSAVHCIVVFVVALASRYGLLMASALAKLDASLRWSRVGRIVALGNGFALTLRLNPTPYLSEDVLLLPDGTFASQHEPPHPLWCPDRCFAKVLEEAYQERAVYLQGVRDLRRERYRKTRAAAAVLAPPRPQ